MLLLLCNCQLKTGAPVWPFPCDCGPLLQLRAMVGVLHSFPWVNCALLGAGHTVTRSEATAEKEDKFSRQRKLWLFFCTCSHLLSLSVLSIMRGIQWLVTCRNEWWEKHKKRNTDAQVTPHYCNENKLWKLRGYKDNWPFLWTSCCWQSRQCKSHSPGRETSISFWPKLSRSLRVSMRALCTYWP